MEIVLPRVCILHVWDYLTVGEVIQYDRALLSSKELRSIHLANIKDKKNIPVSEWTFVRDMKNKKESCDVENLEYVSDICENLTVFNRFSGEKKLQIENHNLKNLYVDLAKRSEVVFESLKSANLERLTIANVPKICIFDTLDSFRVQCPKLRTIILIESDVQITREKIENIYEDQELKVVIKRK